MAKEVRANRDFSERTTATARWAREQIKRQIGEPDISIMLPGDTLDQYLLQIRADDWRSIFNPEVIPPAEQN